MKKTIFILIALTCISISYANTINGPVDVHIQLDQTPRTDQESNKYPQVSGLSSTMPTHISINCRTVECGKNMWVNVVTTVDMYPLSTATFSWSNQKWILNMAAKETKAYGKCNGSNTDNYFAQLTCQWYSDLVMPITFSPSDLDHNIIIKNQSIVFHMFPHDFSELYSIWSKSSGYTDGIIDMAIENTQIQTDYAMTLSPSINSQADLTFSITDACCNISTLGRYSQTITFGGGLNNKGTVSFMPESIDASYSVNSLTQTLQIKEEGTADKKELATIYYWYGDGPCLGKFLCSYGINNSSASIICNDKNAKLEFKHSPINENFIGSILGSWGLNNIDTDCAITVTIPYE